MFRSCCMMNSISGNFLRNSMTGQVMNTLDLPEFKLIIPNQQGDVYHPVGDNESHQGRCLVRKRCQFLCTGDLHSSWQDVLIPVSPLFEIIGLSFLPFLAFVSLKRFCQKLWAPLQHIITNEKEKFIRSVIAPIGQSRRTQTIYFLPWSIQSRN